MCLLVSAESEPLICRGWLFLFGRNHIPKTLLRCYIWFVSTCSIGGNGAGCMIQGIIPRCLNHIISWQKCIHRSSWEGLLLLNKSLLRCKQDFWLRAIDFFLLPSGRRLRICWTRVDAEISRVLINYHLWEGVKKSGLDKKYCSTRVKVGTFLVLISCTVHCT